MKNQKIAIATVVTAALIFLLDFLFYSVIMDNPGGGECCMKEMPDMVWMILGDLLVALAFVVIYDKTAGGGSKMNRGINHGIWIAVFASLGMGLVWYSVMEMEMQMVISDVIYGFVKYCVLGIVVAYLMPDGGARGSATHGGDRGKASGSGEMPPPTGGGGDRGKATGGGE